MKPIAKARAILEAAEAQLRELLASAATDGEYGDVVMMAAWARGVAEMAGSGANAAVEKPRVSSARQPPLPREKRTGGTAVYPQFYRQGDRLVRVAWSKSDQREYEHKAPRDVIKALVKRLSEVGANGRVFSTEALLPIVTDPDGEAPSYQIYAALALLRQVGLIDQHGRQGYSVTRIKDLQSSIDSVWKKLPER